MPISTAIASFFSRLASTVFGHFANRKGRRAKACATFRETFHTELKGLYPRPSNWPQGTGIEHRLRAVFPALQAAVSIFRPYVPKGDQDKFDEAWLHYRTATKREIDDQCYTHYMDITSTTLSTFGSETQITQNGKENLKRNVDRLLSFAQDT